MMHAFEVQFCDGSRHGPFLCLEVALEGARQFEAGSGKRAVRISKGIETVLEGAALRRLMGDRE